MRVFGRVGGALTAIGMRVLKFSIDGYKVIKIQFHNDHNAVKRIIRNLLALTALFSLSQCSNHYSAFQRILVYTTTIIITAQRNDIIGIVFKKKIFQLIINDKNIDSQ